MATVSEAKKPCIACRELIPADATVCSHCHQSQVREKPDRLKRIMTWVGAASAVIALGASILGGVRWLNDRHNRRQEFKTQFAIAESQLQRGEYEESIHSAQEILKADPQNNRALDDQLNAAMLWVENFQVLGDDTHQTSALAAAKLDEILPILDAGLARNHADRSADVLAHIGWAHWLNWHIAQREYGSVAQQNLQSALAIDESNVYANAMLANVMLQTGGSFHEAIEHFSTAVNTGKARPLVRRMQLGGLIYNETPGARAELFRAADDMRKHGEPIDHDQAHRILTFACNPAMNQQTELEETLSAVSAEDAWATWQWLAQSQGANPPSGPEGEFIQAEILEISEKNADAIEKYRSLQRQLRGSQSALISRVDEAIRRLSQVSQ
ncbi:tetratricopeptide repeat protein [Paracidobacterium acidisoli]|uniref:Tetratricopeptide repeat protein n=1 Tax=Paracidobacterium acidisoli TaxID=2303751 RepID=A0A372IRQ7_9BACT|nr:hypothetical protein [Paracidobacterium acidisoli]MBT9330559.1 hypothetical protein [Paracidobacterium acidisoli]